MTTQWLPLSRPARTTDPTVLDILHAAQIRVALLSLLVVGFVLTFGTALMMKVSTQRNLELQARSVAYSVEAAVLFQDAAATRDLLKELLSDEPIAQAWVELGNTTGTGTGPQGPAPQAFATYARAQGGHRWDAALTHLWPVYASAPVLSQGRTLGTVQLQADATQVEQLLEWLLSGVTAGMLLTGVAVAHFSRKLAERLVNPLQALSAHTRSVRTQRALERRAPRSGVYELDQFSSDFDSLLDELQAYQSELLDQNHELKSAHARLEIRVREDALTGAATRAFFEDDLRGAVEKADRNGTRMALLYIDADRFKSINDEFGHDAGDRVLVTLVQRLKSAVREHDLVGRLGGDEFVVLMRSLRNAHDATRLAQQLQEAVAQPLTLHNGVTVVPGISVGVAVFPDHAKTASGLIQAADQSMYLRKRANRAASRTSALDPSAERGRRNQRN